MLSPLIKACGLSVAIALCLSAADPFLGTWKLNLAKSKYDSGRAPKSLTVTYTTEGEWTLSERKGVDSNGIAYSQNHKFKWDGNDYPYKTTTYEGLLSTKKIDSHTEAGSIIGVGKVAIKFRISISKDGRVRTMSGSGTGVDGKPFTTLAVFDKQ